VVDVLVTSASEQRAIKSKMFCLSKRSRTKLHADAMSYSKIIRSIFLQPSFFFIVILF